MREICKVKKEPIKIRIGKELAKNKYLYILLVPVLAYYLAFCYGPMFGLVIAFKDYSIIKGVAASPWVGFQYFKEFFSGIYFSRTLKNTLIISFASIVFGFPFPIIFALLLNELRGNRLKKIVQTTTYLPHFISLVVICGMIMNFFTTDGLVSSLISLLGGENKTYIADPKWFRTIFVSTDIWQGFGWNSIIYVAALANVDPTLYEAASIDGAGRFKKILHVTLPTILPTIVTMLILRLGQVMSVSSEKVILLYSANTMEVADVISSYVYRIGITGSRFGFSAAVGLFQSIVNIIMLVFANTISRKFTDTSIY